MAVPDQRVRCASWLEAFEDWLTLPCVKVPAVLRKTLHSTNPIESLCATVRGCEGHITRDRHSRGHPPGGGEPGSLKDRGNVINDPGATT